MKAKVQPGARCLAALSALVTLGLFVAAGCEHSPLHDYEVSAGFVGNAACAPCHATEFNLHRVGRHARTLREFDAASMGVDWPTAPGPIKGSDFSLYPSGVGYSMGWQDRPEDAMPVQYALGSEREAFTFISIYQGKNVVELPQSYFHPIHSWHVTPGQEPAKGQPVGRFYNEDVSRRCILCHATALPDNGTVPDRRYFGVGCESCHGPGRDHIAAMRDGEKDDLHILKLGSIGATQLNRLCGRCHRNQEDLSANESRMTMRFEPYAVMKSRCFLESGNTLSCITCHDPHTDASTDAKAYERACLSCHPSQPQYGPTISTGSTGKPCPVNPKTGCIPCHMPKRLVTEDSPVAFTEHYIHLAPSEPQDPGRIPNLR